MSVTPRQAEPLAVERMVPTAESVLQDTDPDCDKSLYARLGRHRPLRETIDAAWRLRAPAGISRVADLTGLDRVGLPVFNTYRTNAEAGNLSVTCGKGLTLEAALASALMEAHERYCGEQRGRGGPVLTVDEAREALPLVLHPRDLVLDTRSRWEDSSPLEWVPTRDLLDGDVVWVPADAVFTPYRTNRSRLFAGHSDGLASGNCLTEATLHALYELIERDSRAFGEVLRQGYLIDSGSLPDPLSGVAESLRDAGITTSLFAFSSSLGITSFFALGDDRLAENPMLVNAGAGCHLNPAVGASRALTELAQSRLSVISGSREDFSTRFRERRTETYQRARERADRWCHGWQVQPFDAIENQSVYELEADLATVCDRLREAGLGRVLVTDLTLEPLGPRVVKVIVPGLEFAANEPSRIGSRFYKQARKMRER